MSQIANVEYFYRKCNQVLLTTYSSSDWGGDGNIKKAINLEWLSLAVNKVYNDIHQPKTGCNLKLSSKFDNETSKITVDKILVDDVINYLKNFNKICDNDCACPCTTACVRNCSGPDNCSNSSACNCNCVCTCANCACNCGNNTECECDCENYDCNCNIVKNCTSNCVYNCGQCNCACDCQCACHSDSHSNTAHGSGGLFHTQGYQEGHSAHGDGSGSSGGEVNSTCSDSKCFIGSTLVTMADGSKKRIDQIKIGDRVKTLNGKDKVFLIESGEAKSYIIKFTDGTVLETASAHPFPLKNGRMASINPLDTPEMNEFLQAVKFEIGDELLSGHKVESIEETGRIETLYNLNLENDLVYYVEDVPCMTANTFICTAFSLLTNDFDAIEDKEDIEKIKSMITPYMANEVANKVKKIATFWNKYNFSFSIYDDFRYLTDQINSLMNEEDDSIKRIYLGNIVNYELRF
jgi:hypothetical protein